MSQSDSSLIDIVYFENEPHVVCVQSVNDAHDRRFPVQAQQSTRCSLTQSSVVGSVSVTGCLHAPIVGPTGRSDPGYVRVSVRPVGQAGRIDCSRTADICQSNQCGLLADYNTAYAAA